MDEPITAEEVFAMAIGLEDTGRIFYESLGMGWGDPQMGKLCARLARAEARHAAVFNKMRTRLLKADKLIPIAKKHTERFRAIIKEVVVPKPQEVCKVTASGRWQDALAMAVRMEEASIRFYKGILALRKVRPNETVLIDRIIEEEESHLRDLKAQAV